MCEGYAKILQQVLKSSGIDCKYISGVGRDWWDLDKTEEGEPHGWNQVKIDGQWYNCDLTWDASRIKENRLLEYCLQSDEDFILHETESTEKQICGQSYDRNKVNLYYATSDLLKLLKDMEQYSKSDLQAAYTTISDLLKLLKDMEQYSESDLQAAYTTISRTKDEREQTFSHTQTQTNIDDFEER